LVLLKRCKKTTMARENLNKVVKKFRFMVAEDLHDAFVRFVSRKAGFFKGSAFKRVEEKKIKVV